MPSFFIQRSLDHILKLANISWPVKRHKAAHALGIDAVNSATDARRVFLDEISHEHRNIVGALAQRRHANWKHIEALKQIRAKGTFTDRLWQVAVGCRDDPHVGLDRLRTSEALKLEFLQHA